MNPLPVEPCLTPAAAASLALFALVSSITPGPNNLMLASSGLTFGFRRTVPHMLGVTLGFMLMLILVGCGLGAVFLRWPPAYSVLQAGGSLYLLYLAWRIARSGPVASGAAAGRPFTFLQAAAFQWVNPKAWVMAVGVVAAYTPPGGFYVNLMFAALICGLVNLPSIGLWTAFGTALRQALRRPGAVRAFNRGMALLLVASLYPVLRDFLIGTTP